MQSETNEGVEVMLFRKRIEKNCSYCRYGTALDETCILCTKRGVVASGGKCRKFEYDPIKRVPGKAKALDFEKYNDVDYSL